MNLYNLYKDLSYSDFDCTHKATGNRPLKLGQFFNFGDFSFFLPAEAININAFW